MFENKSIRKPAEPANALSAEELAAEINRWGYVVVVSEDDTKGYIRMETSCNGKVERHEATESPRSGNLYPYVEPPGPLGERPLYVKVQTFVGGQIEVQTHDGNALPVNLSLKLVGSEEPPIEGQQSSYGTGGNYREYLSFEIPGKLLRSSDGELMFELKAEVP